MTEPEYRARLAERWIPRDEIKAALDWLDREIYPGLVGRRLVTLDPATSRLVLDTEGIAAWALDTYLRYRLMGYGPQASRDATIRRVQEAASGQPLPLDYLPPEPADPFGSSHSFSPSPSHANPGQSLVGVVRTTEHGFRDDSGPVLLVGCHHGDGLYLCKHDYPRHLEVLGRIEEAGYTHVRVFGDKSDHHSFWAGHASAPQGYGYRSNEVWPDYFEVARQFVADYLDAGLRVEWAFGGLDAFSDENETRRFMRDLGRTFASIDHVQPILLAQINEAPATMPAPITPEHAKSLLEPFFAELPTCIRATSYSYSEELQALQAWKWDVVPIHPKRDYSGEGWNSIRHGWGPQYNESDIFPFGVPVYLSEPGGIGTSVDGADHPRWNYSREQMARVMATQAAATLISGQGYVYVCSPGIRYRPDDWGVESTINRGSFEDCPGFIEVPRLAAELPRDTGQWGGIAHAGRSEAWVTSRELDQTVRRIDQTYSLSRGKGLAVAYGVTGPYRPLIKRATREVRYRNPLTAHLLDIFSNVQAGTDLPALDTMMLIEATF